MKQLLITLLSLMFVSLHAQTVSDVIDKYAAHMGGLAAFNKISSAKLTGTVKTSGNDLKITIQIINGKAMRTDVDAMGQIVTNCYFNGKGWKINPFAGIPTATEVTGPELADFNAQSFLAGPLMDYKARGHQVEMMGEENVDELKAYKIKLTNKDDGKVSTYFISLADYALIKSVTTRNIQGQDMEIETYYSDLKTISDAKFFMNRILKMQGAEIQSIHFDQVELNVPVDEKIFTMPN